MSALDPAPLSHRMFASDNYSGICPEVWNALEKAKSGHSVAYGEDPWCQKASDLIRDLFETDCEVFFTFNGTAANSLSLAHLCQSYHSVLCHTSAHIEVDECGAPEFFSNGSKLLLVPGENGKIDPKALQEIILKRTDVHFPKPRVVTITQSTESGTVYSLTELHALQEIIQKHGLHFHMDGARFANAISSLDVSPKEITWKIGVEVLSFGFTKNGAPVGDAVVFFKKELAKEFEFRCKQAGQLASKMRFLATPIIGLLETGAWLKNARHANEMAELLKTKISALPNCKILYPRESNAVFVTMPLEKANRLKEKGWRFYDFIGSGYRFMTTWDTTSEDIESLIRDLKAL